MHIFIVDAQAAARAQTAAMGGNALLAYHVDYLSIFENEYGNQVWAREGSERGGKERRWVGEKGDGSGKRGVERKIQGK